MQSTLGLSHEDTVVDFGAGWTEFDFCLRKEFDWRGRYIPVDGGIDGTDLNEWTPKRKAEWFVGLEILEHLSDPFALVQRIKPYATKGILVSTPNPDTTDVLGMDPTHVTPITFGELATEFSRVYRTTFYGQEDDSLFAVWLAKCACKCHVYGTMLWASGLCLCFCDGEADASNRADD